MSVKATKQAIEEKAITEMEAMDIVSKIQGPEGIFAAAETFKKQIESTKAQKAMLEAKLVGYHTVVTILERLSVHWGIKKLDIPHAVGAEPAPSGNHVDKETTERIAKSMCIHKDRKTKKWCSRKLKSKKEKENGYCRICQVRLGMAEKPGPKPKE
jgi:hypothetical protein